MNNPRPPIVATNHSVFGGPDTGPAGLRLSEHTHSYDTFEGAAGCQSMQGTWVAWCWRGDQETPRRADLWRRSRTQDWSPKSIGTTSRWSISRGTRGHVGLRGCPSLPLVSTFGEKGTCFSYAQTLATRSGSRSRIATRAPKAVNALAIPRPMTAPPPVTTATLSLRSTLCGFTSIVFADRGSHATAYTTVWAKKPAARSTFAGSPGLQPRPQSARGR